jgi:hypothetical protein
MAPFGDGTRRHVLFAMAALVAWSAGPRPSQGYRFLYDHHGDFAYRVGHRFRGIQNRLTWDPAIWPPGGTLTFVLVDSPDWQVELGVVREAAEEAMAVWSRLATADIRWQLGGTVPADENLRVLSRISPTDEATIRSTHVHIERLPGSDPDVKNTIVSCNILVGPNIASSGHDLLKWILVHELGHCLGLHHPDESVPGYSERASSGYWQGYKPPSGWARQPIMAQGFYDASPGLTLDDRVGASLLRPRAGWIERTGTIRGNVLVEGEPVPLVHVLATRLGPDGAPEESVGRFTDIRGEFYIEGLPPGDYALLVRPILRGDLLHPVVSVHIPIRSLHLRTTFRTAPVSVVASRIAGPITLTMRRDERAPIETFAR